VQAFYLERALISEPPILVGRKYFVELTGPPVPGKNEIDAVSENYQEAKGTANARICRILSFSSESRKSSDCMKSLGIVRIH
jgi:hypothetical protein